MRVAVVGAGMAGVTIARKLADAGCDVHVFDKGRSFGGRLATRVTGSMASGHLAFDHGAPWLRPKRARFRQFLADREREGSAVQVPSREGAATGLPHMNQLFGQMTRGIHVNLSTEITSIARGKGSWALGANDGRAFTRFDILVIAIPAPQVVSLIGPLVTSWMPLLNSVIYDPGLTMMAAYQEPLAIEPTLNSPDNSFIHLQIKESAKPGRLSHADRWVVHADANFSRANLELERDEIAKVLHDEFRRANRLSQVEPIFLSGHRWRFCRTAIALGRTHLWDLELRLGLAGDWCLGPDAEHSFESGLAVADAVLAAVKLPQSRSSGN